jgi:uncharacterized membrane protein (DUF485 family)
MPRRLAGEEGTEVNVASFGAACVSVILCAMPQADSPPPVGGTHEHDDHPELARRNARAGLWLFAVYLAAYGLFMGLAAFSPKTMAMATPLGPNLAIVYGFGLIFGAVVLALLYMLICKLNADRFQQQGQQ